MKPLKIIDRVVEIVWDAHGVHPKHLELPFWQEMKQESPALYNAVSELARQLPVEWRPVWWKHLPKDVAPTRDVFASGHQPVASDPQAPQEYGMSREVYASGWPAVALSRTIVGTFTATFDGNTLLFCVSTNGTGHIIDMWPTTSTDRRWANASKDCVGMTLEQVLVMKHHMYMVLGKPV